MRAQTIATATASLMLCVAVTLGSFSCDAAPTTAIAAGQPQRITGTLLSVEFRPNRPGANCGYHFDLTVAVMGHGQQVLHVYDMRVSEDVLIGLKGRKVEIDYVAGGIVEGVRPANEAARDTAALSALSTIKYC